MVTKSAILLLVLIALVGHRPISGQTPESPDPTSTQSATGVVKGSESTPVVLPNTFQFDMRSRQGLVYRIFVARPTGEQPENGWPVVYHTDGNSSFPVLTAAVEGQSRNDRPAVIVGIGYPEESAVARHRRRAFDLTMPANPDWLANMARPFADLETGSCHQFHSFLIDELKPEIERRFRINMNQQALFGHSFGGLFALYACLTQPESFQTFIASSPSLWWNAGSLIDQERSFRKRFVDQKLNVRLLLTVGAEELSPPNKADRKKPPAFLMKTELGNAQQVIERLQGSGIRGLHAEFRELPDAHHGSAELPAAAVGMKLALSAPPTDTH